MTPLKQMRGHALRFIAYLFWIAAVAWLVMAEGYRDGVAARYMEQSLLEYSQTACLLFTALVFWLSARRSEHWRAVCISLLFIALIGTVREQDSYLDRYVFDGAWQLIALSLAVGWGVYLWRRGRGFVSQVNSFAETRCAGLLVSGFLVVFVFSRLFGRQNFWQAIMGDGYVRVVKNVVEEGLELLGYGLIVIAATETWFYLRDLGRAQGATARP